MLSYKKALRQFIVVNLILLALQIVTVFSKSGSFINALHLPVCVYLEIILTLGVHLTLYFILSLIQTFWFWGFLQFKFSKTINQRLIIVIIVDTCIALCSANAAFFPLSLFSKPLLFLYYSPFLLHCILFISWSLLGLFTCIALSRLKKMQHIGLACLCIVFLLSYLSRNPHPTSEASVPNIILIGIDSLNPDAVTPSNTASLSAFVQQSIWFKETISPLARTYPAWNTLLTGLYPAHHHATYNLVKPDNQTTQHSIAWILRRLGYATLFATDDRRFNSIDKEFGFERVIGPKRGVNDLLLGAFNDFPLSNLLINQDIARFLFPYNHMNRASFFSYYPQTFTKALKKELVQAHQPLFLAVHFTLPHWPYAFASSSPARVNDEFRVEDREPLYQEALHAVDKQVAELFKSLKKQHYLDNSLVILLSDHGETLFTPNSRDTSVTHYQGRGISQLARYFTQFTATPLNKSAGHGSDLLSSAQYHCLLAAQMYQNGRRVTQSASIHTRVALIDVAPTILDYLTQETHHSISQLHMDGESLLPQILNPLHPLKERAFILESGMLPNQRLSKLKARELGQRYFKVTTNGLLEVREDQLATLDAMKLYGIIERDWVLALYPTPRGYLPVIQQLSNHAWMDSLNTPFAQHSPAKKLLKKLSVFYHHDWPLRPS